MNGKSSSLISHYKYTLTKGKILKKLLKRNLCKFDIVVGNDTHIHEIE